MEWVILSLTSAFFLATSDALTKRAVQDQNEYIIALFRLLFTLPVLVITLLLVPWPKLDEVFYLAFFMALPFELITIIMQKKRYQNLLAPGICYSLMVITHMSAMKLTKVAYMVSIKRTSLLMAVLYGYFMFREENIRSRFFGAALMFVGFVLVVTAK